jgi:threonyl-tRNA synthetase
MKKQIVEQLKKYDILTSYSDNTPYAIIEKKDLEKIQKEISQIVGKDLEIEDGKINETQFFGLFDDMQIYALLKIRN